MQKDSKGMIIIILAAAMIVVVAISSLYSYSGMGRPLTVVESNSMQHSDDTSYLGVIDTGDMAVMVSPDKKGVTTYFDGLSSGYSKFGAYGDVIIYYRENKNPVIHRAIIWLEYADGKWSAPSLKDYEKGTIWDNPGTWDDLSGVLSFYYLPYKDGTMSASVNLDSMKDSGLAHSGYLTKGDRNVTFDQSSGIHSGPVEKSELKAIAGIEIPWLGCVKLLVNHKNVGMIPHNSVPCLAVFIIDILTFFVLISVLLDYRMKLKEDVCP